MSLKTVLTGRLGLQQPLILAPLGGAWDTTALAAAACEAGALGTLGAAYWKPERIADCAARLRAATRRPFGLNLFAPVAARPSVDPAAALGRLAPYHAELGLPPPAPPPAAADEFEAQLAAGLESGAAVFSFTFGIPPASAVQAIKQRGMLFFGTATTVAEAVLLEQAGADAVVLQGAEAGGHRGTFHGEFADALIGTMALVPQAADAVRIPVIASGGIMDGRGIAAALALGAAAVQLGTAFMTCDEAPAPASYKQAILAGREDRTRVTRAFSGRPARGLVNRFMEDFDANPESILPYPQQNALTRALRTAATQADRAEYLSLWAGQGLRLARRQSVAALVARLAAETEAAVARLAGRG